MHSLPALVAFLGCCSQITAALPQIKIVDQIANLGTFQSDAIKTYTRPPPPTIALGDQLNPSPTTAPLVMLHNRDDRGDEKEKHIEPHFRHYYSAKPSVSTLLDPLTTPNGEVKPTTNTVDSKRLEGPSSVVADPGGTAAKRTIKGMNGIVVVSEPLEKRVKAASTSTRRPIPTEVEHHNMDMHTSVKYFHDTSDAFQPTIIRNTASSSLDTTSYSTLQSPEPDYVIPKGSTLSKRYQDTKVSGDHNDEEPTTTYTVYIPPTTTSTIQTTSMKIVHVSTKSPEVVAEFTTITSYKNAQPTYTRRVTITQKVTKKDLETDTPRLSTGTKTITQVFKSTTITATVISTYSANKNITNTWYTSPTALWYTPLTSLSYSSTATSSPYPSNTTSFSHYKTWPGLEKTTTSSEEDGRMSTMGIETAQTTSTQEGDPSTPTKIVYEGGPSNKDELS